MNPQPIIFVNTISIPKYSGPKNYSIAFNSIPIYTGEITYQGENLDKFRINMFLVCRLVNQYGL